MKVSAKFVNVRRFPDFQFSEYENVLYINDEFGGNWNEMCFVKHEKWSIKADLKVRQECEEQGGVHLVRLVGSTSG